MGQDLGQDTADIAGANQIIEHNALTDGPVEQFAVYISSQVLANSITFADFSDSEDTFRLEIDGEEIRVNVTLG